MSMEILGKYWKEIVAKVIKPLWITEFSSMYKAKKLDYCDFESLAGYELTKAFKNFDAEKSNPLTFATNILKIKPKTELRDEGRDKRVAISTSVSLNEKISESSETTYEHIIEDIYEEEQDKTNIEDMLNEILKLLKPKERKILSFACNGFDNKQIADSLRIPIEEVLAVRKKVSEKSEIKRIARKYGYFGGKDDEI